MGIDFNIPPFAGGELEYMQAAIDRKKICGDGAFTHRCARWFEEKCAVAKTLLTTSCTHALEMAALLADIAPGDEVIMPSYTFVSTANAFVLRGAKIVFVDIRPDTMNMDENLIEAAITQKTRAIVPVHYAGVGCEMSLINEIAARYNLLVIEDAAQGVMAAYRGQALGAIGDLGCYSFHETKNYSMGEGGALLIRTGEYTEKAEVIREKGTNRSRFLRGQVDKYTWVDVGSSYLPSDLNAAYLWAQLEKAEDINQGRLEAYRQYETGLKKLADSERIALPFVPEHCTHNAHMFYIKLKDLEQRTDFIAFMKSRDIGTAFHYVPLHSSPAGLRYARFSGEDRHTTQESERLVRLPMYFGLTGRQIDTVVEAVYDFFAVKGA